MRFTTTKIIATGLIGLTLSTSHVFAADENTSKVVATVNGVEITQETLDAVATVVSRSTQGKGVNNESLLDDLIITELARQEAEKAGLGKREDIQAKVKDFSDKLVLNTWTQEKAESFKPTEEELKKAYEEHTGGDNQFEYKARHILLKSEDEAKAVISELEGGVDFADLAKQKSTGPSGPKGGDLGWFKKESMVKPFSNAVADMEPGTVSKEPVQTQFGWHVIKLEERRESKPPAFETLKPQLERQHEQKKMLEYMETLRAAADIKIMLPEQPQAAETEAAESTDNPAAAPAEDKK